MSARLNGGELVGDHQRRATLHKSFQSAHHDLLRFGVEPGRRLIQDEYRGVPITARDGDALSLSPDSVPPRSPTTVSNPFGRFRMKSSQ